MFSLFTCLFSPIREELRGGGTYKVEWDDLPRLLYRDFKRPPANGNDNSSDNDNDDIDDGLLCNDVLIRVCVSVSLFFTQLTYKVASAERRSSMVHLALDR